MFKKFFILFSLILAVSMPVYAVKSKGISNQKTKVNQIDIYSDATIYKVKLENSTNFLFILSNIECPGIANRRTYRTMNGYRYKDPHKFGTSININNYASSLLYNNAGNIYVKSQGLGMDGYFVGEVYIGNVSLGRHLVEKGYCSYIK